MAKAGKQQTQTKLCDLCSRLSRWVICPADMASTHVAKDSDHREILFKHHESWSDLCRVAKECGSCSLLLQGLVDDILQNLGLDEVEVNWYRQRLISEDDSLTPDSEPFLQIKSDFPSEYFVCMSEYDIDAMSAHFTIGYPILHYGIRRDRFFVYRASFLLYTDAGKPNKRFMAFFAY